MSEWNLIETAPTEPDARIIAAGGDEIDILEPEIVMRSRDGTCWFDASYRTVRPLYWCRIPEPAAWMK